MSVPPIAEATLQAALVNAGSNVLAQGIKAYRAGIPFKLDLQALMQFTTCAFIVSPLGYLWLENLESWFPGMTEPKKPSEKPEKGARSEPKAEKPRLNVKNTVVKVLIDQTIGAAWNTILFISTMGMLQGLDYGTIENQIHQNFWPIMKAGLKMWPFVSALNFTVVPPNQRLLVSSLFGVIWGVYLSLQSG